jgi:hypothetical protein
LPTKTKSTSAPLDEDAIRHRAYLLWEADGRPDGQAEHYWMKASEPDDSARPKVRTTAEKTPTALKSAKPKGKAASPAEPSPAKTKTGSKAADKPKLRAAAGKASAQAVRARPAAKALSPRAEKQA